MRGPILCFALFMAAGSVSAGTWTFQGGPVEIPSSGPADPSFVYVEGVEGEVTRLTVRFIGLSHSYGQETMVALTNPDGWSTLIWDAPDCRFNSVNIVIDDAAAANPADRCSYGASLPAGSYKPGYAGDDHELTIPIAPTRPMFETLGELTATNPNGRWILWAEDFVNGDGGRIGSWEIIIETAAD